MKKRMKVIKQELESFRAQAVSRAAKNMVEHAETVNGVHVVKTVLPIDPASAKDIVFKVREALPEKLVFIGQHLDKEEITRLLDARLVD